MLRIHLRLRPLATQAQAGQRVPERATAAIRGDKACRTVLDKTLIRCNDKLAGLRRRMPGGELEFAIIATARCLNGAARLYASQHVQV